MTAGLSTTASRPTPRVAVAMPIYNGEPYLVEAVESILGQTFTDFELILCDNSSTDGTQEWCRKWLRQDSRVRYHRNRRNVGLAANFGLAADLCSAPLIKWAAGDDILEPTCLADCVAVLDAHPDVVLAVPQGRLIGPDGSRLPPEADVLRPIDWPDDAVGRVRTYIDMLTSVEAIAVMLYLYGVFRADAVPFRLTLPPYPMSDREVLLRALLAGRFLETDRPSLSIRIHDASAGSGIFGDPAKIFRSMSPNEPQPRMLSWWQHKHHRRLLGVLERADLSAVQRRELQAYYLYRVGRRMAEGKSEGLSRRWEGRRSRV